MNYNLHDDPEIAALLHELATVEAETGVAQARAPAPPAPTPPPQAGADEDDVTDLLAELAAGASDQVADTGAASSSAEARAASGTVVIHAPLIGESPPPIIHAPLIGESPPPVIHAPLIGESPPPATAPAPPTTAAGPDCALIDIDEEEQPFQPMVAPSHAAQMVAHPHVPPHGPGQGQACPLAQRAEPGAEPGPAGAGAEPGPAGAVTAARPPAPFRPMVAPSPPVEPVLAVESLGDPHRLGRSFLRAHYWHAAGVPTLRHWQGAWWVYRGGCYRPLAEAELRARVIGHIKSEYDAANRAALARWSGEGAPPAALPVTAGVVNNTLGALGDLALLAGAYEPPCWIGAEPFAARETLPFRNQLIHVPTGRACAPGPHFFAMHCAPYDHDPCAPEPHTWLQFLGAEPLPLNSRIRHGLWPGDRASVDLVQEWLAYCMTADTSHQKMLLVVGPRRSGKSTLARVMRALLGPEACCAPSLHSLNSQFGMQPLIGKRLALMADLRLGRADVTNAVANLLAISGEDSRSIDRKFRDPLTLQLHVRFALLSNELPRITDTSSALIGRMLVLKLVNTAFGAEDPTLTDRLLRELPGIANWTLRAYRRLLDRGYFMQPTSAAGEVEALTDLASPVAEFVRDRCLVGPAYSVEIMTLYDAWCSWCADRGKIAGDSNRLGRDLRAILPELHVGQKRDGAGGRVRRYDGIALNHP